MDVLGDVVARERRTDRTALRDAESGRSYDYRRFCTITWKVGNLLRHYGVRRGGTVVIADDPGPEPVFALYGTVLLGGVARYGGGGSPGGDVDALVVPASSLDDHDVAPGTTCIAYGDAPEDPTVRHFEREVWSENPTAPPYPVTAEDLALLAAPPNGADAEPPRYTHGDVLSAATEVIESLDLDANTTVAVRGSFTDPGVVAAGLVAPLVVGGSVQVGRYTPTSTEADATVGGPQSNVDVSTTLP